MNSDIQHFGTMFSGCEAINSGDHSSPDSQYTLAVLKMHAADAGFIAGTEGFVDAIKKGAQSTIEWIKKMIKAFLDFILRRKKQIAPEAPVFKKRKENYRTYKQQYDELFEKVSDELTDIAVKCFEGPVVSGAEKIQGLLAEYNNRNKEDLPHDVRRALTSMMDLLMDLEKMVGTPSKVSHSYYGEGIWVVIRSMTEKCKDLSYWLSKEGIKHLEEDEDFDAAFVKDVVMGVSSLYESVFKAGESMTNQITAVIKANAGELERLKNTPEPPIRLSRDF